jgi:hypothetical protein
MRRRQVIAGIVSFAVVVAGGAVLVWPPPRPCLATFRQVREGMTREEVIATVGGPPTATSSAAAPYAALPRVVHEWVSDDGYLFVLFDSHDRAAYVLASPRHRSPGFWDRLLARLGP